MRDNKISSIDNRNDYLLSIVTEKKAPKMGIIL